MSSSMDTVNIVPIEIFEWEARVTPKWTPCTYLIDIVDEIVYIKATLALTCQ